jgi:muconate cycloisomerase
MDVIARVDVFPVHVPARSVLRLARGTALSAAGHPRAFVRVADVSGAEGWGEASPSPLWSDETQETVISTVRSYLAPAVCGHDPADIAGLHAAMDDVIAPGLTNGQPIAKSAVDMAVHDLLARRLGVPLASLFGRARVARLPLSWVVSAASAEEAARQAEEGTAAGYRGFKVKLGLTPDRDVEIMRAVRAVDGQAYLWGDANQAYDAATALRLGRRLADLGTAVFEQPVPARDIDGLRRLRADGSVPIAVDESVFSAANLLHLLRHEAIDVFVAKVSKLGGLWHARRCLELAESAGIPVLGSGLTESGLGAAASASLYGGFALAGPADLNGPQFLAAAPETPAWRVEDGALVLPDSPGIGLTVTLPTAEAGI